MKVVVCLDGDGHFRVARLQQDRDKALEVLKAVDDGSYFEDTKDDNEFPEDYKAISPDRWESVMRSFEQRGTFELKDLP